MMSDLNFWYPAFLFPAIPLMMISFGNRTAHSCSIEYHDSIIVNNQLYIKSI